MKKVATLPLLGAGLMALALAMTSVIAPSVWAATAQGANTTVTLVVDQYVGIDTDNVPTDQGATTSISNVSLTLNPMEADEVIAGGYVINNTNYNGTLTVQDKDDNTSLTSSTTNSTIVSAAGKPQNGSNTAKWSLKVGGADSTHSYQTVPASNGTPLTVLGSQAPGRAPFVVTYAASAGMTTNGTYTDTLVYNYTVADQTGQ